MSNVKALLSSLEGLERARQKAVEGAPLLHPNPGLTWPAPDSRWPAQADSGAADKQSSAGSVAARSEVPCATAALEQVIEELKVRHSIGASTAKLSASSISNSVAQNSPSPKRSGASVHAGTCGSDDCGRSDCGCADSGCRECSSSTCGCGGCGSRGLVEKSPPSAARTSMGRSTVFTAGVAQFPSNLGNAGVAVEGRTDRSDGLLQEAPGVLKLADTMHGRISSHRLADDNGMHVDNACRSCSDPALRAAQPGVKPGSLGAISSAALVVPQPVQQRIVRSPDVPALPGSGLQTGPAARAAPTELPLPIPTQLQPGIGAAFPNLERARLPGSTWRRGPIVNPRLPGCGLPAVPQGTTAPFLQTVATMALPCDWRHNYGIGYDRPGTAVADANQLYGRVARLGLVLQPHRNHESKVGGGWIASESVAESNLNSTACDCKSPAYAVDFNLVPPTNRNIQPKKGSFSAFYLHGAIDVDGLGSEARPPEVPRGANFKLSSRSFPVYAPAQGTVRSRVSGDTGGNILVLEHRGLDGFAYQSFFGHLRNGLANDLFDMAIYPGDTRKLVLARYWVRRMLGFRNIEALSLADVQASLANLRAFPDESDERNRLAYLEEVWGTDAEVVRVAVGETVSPGQLLGYAGTTGTFRFNEADVRIAYLSRVTSNTHLHYFFAVNCATTPAPRVSPDCCGSDLTPLALVDCLSATVPSSARISIDPYGVYQYITELDAQGNAATADGSVGRRMYPFVGPLVGEPGEIRGQNPWILNPAPGGGPAAGVAPITTWLRQHDPIYTAERIRVYTRSLCNSRLVRARGNDGAVEDLLNDPRLFRLNGNRDPLPSPLFSTPIPFRPLGSMRFNDPAPNEPLVGVVRTFDEQLGMPVVRLFRSAGLGGRDARSCHPFGCGDDGELLVPGQWPCFSEPDVATRPDPTGTSGHIIMVAHVTREQRPGIVGATRGDQIVVHEGRPTPNGYAWNRALVVPQVLGNAAPPTPPTAQNPIVRLAFDPDSQSWLLAWTSGADADLVFAVRPVASAGPLGNWQWSLAPPNTSAGAAHPLRLTRVSSLDIAPAGLLGASTGSAQGRASMLLSAVAQNVGTNADELFLVGFALGRAGQVQVVGPNGAPPPAPGGLVVPDAGDWGRLATPSAATAIGPTDVAPGGLYLSNLSGTGRRSGAVLVVLGRDGLVLVFSRLLGLWRSEVTVNLSEEGDLQSPVAIACFTRFAVSIATPTASLAFSAR